MPDFGSIVGKLTSSTVALFKNIIEFNNGKKIYSNFSIPMAGNIGDTCIDEEGLTWVKIGIYDVDWICTATQNIIKHPTGFEDKTKIRLYYDPTTRKVRLKTTSATAVWVRGKRKKLDYTDPNYLETASAHADTKGIYFLFFYDDNSGNIIFDFTPDFDLKNYAPAAFCNYLGSGVGFAQTELHLASRNTNSHINIHELLGAYIRGLIEVTAYTPASDVDANKRPTFGSVTHVDECNINSIASVGTGYYCVAYRNGAIDDVNGDYVYLLDQTDFYLFGTYIKYNKLTGSTWSIADIPAPLNANAITYIAYYVCVQACTDDDNSQKYRMIVVPSQNYYAVDNATSSGAAALAACIAEQFETLQRGYLSRTDAEIVPVAKIILEAKTTYTSSGKCVLNQVQPLSKTRSSRASYNQVGAITASTIATNTTNFNGILSSADDLVQKALDTIDDSCVKKLDTAGIIMPFGTTAQRNTTYTFRRNTDLGIFEYYNGSIWKPLAPQDIIVNQSSHGFAVGKIISKRTGSTAYDYLKPDFLQTQRQFLGVCLAVVDANNFVLRTSGLCDVFSSLTAGSAYWTSTNGDISNAPYKGDQSYDIYTNIGYAITTTTIMLVPQTIQFGDQHNIYCGSPNNNVTVWTNFPTAPISFNSGNIGSMDLLFTFYYSDGTNKYVQILNYLLTYITGTNYTFDLISSKGNYTDGVTTPTVNFTGSVFQYKTPNLATKSAAMIRMSRRYHNLNTNSTWNI